MVRTYVRKTQRGLMSEDNIRDATLQVIVEGKSVMSVARRTNMNRMTLARYVKKYRISVQTFIV